MGELGGHNDEGGGGRWEHWDVGGGVCVCVPGTSHKGQQHTLAHEWENTSSCTQGACWVKHRPTNSRTKPTPSP